MIAKNIICALGVVAVFAMAISFAEAQSGMANTSERMSGGGGKGQAGRATTVKSSKSNTSDRMGGGGGGKAAKTTTVKSSKSNTSD
jgi:hypothetical protein